MGSEAWLLYVVLDSVHIALVQGCTEYFHYSQELQKLFTWSLFIEMTNILQIYEPCLQLISLLNYAWEPNLDLNKFIWEFWSFENLSNLLRKIRIYFFLDFCFLIFNVWFYIHL